MNIKKITIGIILTAALSIYSFGMAFAGEIPWNLILVNKSNAISKTFAPPVLKAVQGSYMADSRIIGDYKKMKKAAEKDGVSIIITSAYRSYFKQQSLVNASVDRYIKLGYSKKNALKKTYEYIAKPGTSEHQTGLALDIITKGYYQLDEGYANTRASKWLAKNAYKYGFILRYPKDGKSKTGIEFEPWHYRYIGVSKAKEFKKSGLVYEDFYAEYIK